MDSQKPKEKIFYIPSEYVTVSLISIFVIFFFMAIIFIAKKSDSQSMVTSVPVPSGQSVLSEALVSPPKEVPNSLPFGPSAAPASSKPKPSPTKTPSPSPTSTPIPSPSSTPEPTPTQTPTPTPTASPTIVPSPSSSPSPSPS